jgi:tetratricopeptide (TPR) repeat protein
MLFDLKSGKRRRVVQIVFGGLAALFAIGFIGFNIGSEVGGGGVVDEILGDGDGDSQYEDQIKRAEERLQTRPNDPQALLELVRYHYLSATSGGITTDPQTGVVEISEGASAELEQTVSAWEDYLKTDPKRANVAGATSASQAYRFLNDAQGAAEAQEIVAEEQNTSAAYGQLAFYLYADYQFAAADEAARRAVELSDPSQRKQVEKNLARLAELAREQQKQLAKAEEKGGGGGGGEGAQQLEDPFGALGGASAVPTTPSP